MFIVFRCLLSLRRFDVIIVEEKYYKSRDIAPQSVNVFFV